MTTSQAGPAVTSRWVPIAAFTLVACANQMLWLNFTPITTGVASHLKVSTSAVGTLSEIFPLVYIILAVPIGRTLDRWFRPTLAAGAGLNALGAVLRLGGHGYGWILAGQSVVAVSQPAILNAITGTASRYLSEAHRPVGIALGSAGTFVGFILAFVLGGLFGAAHLHTILLISAGFAVVAAVVLCASLAGRRFGLSPTSSGPTTPFKEVWGDRVLRTLSVLVFFGFGVFIALTTWVETLLKPAGVSSGTTDTVLTFMVVAGVVGCAVVPPVAAARSMQPVVLFASAVAIGGSCLLLAVAPGVPAAAVALPVFGLLVLPDLPVVLELAERRAGPAGGTATAVLWLAGNAGGIVVALVIQGLQGSPAAAFSVLAVLGLLGTPICLLLKRQLQAPEAQSGGTLGE